MRILVVTVVHHPDDARIHRRQVGALIDAGHEVTLAAPWSAFGADPAGMRTVDLPRAAGRARLRPFLSAASLLRRHGDAHDLVLIHDPELLPAVMLSRPTTPVVWDVHEDTAAALVDRPWMPPALRRVAGYVVRRFEGWAENRLRIILAEDGYQSRFRRQHPVIRNLPPVAVEQPRTGVLPQVVYVGRVSRLRGAEEMVALGKRLALVGIDLHLVGPVDGDVQAMVRSAAGEGAVTLHGFVPNEQALQIVDGSLVGLSLLHDISNYRVSAPTKVYEYLSRGVPVVTSPLPIPREIVEANGLGLVVGLDDLDAMEAFIIRLRDHPDVRRQIGDRAYHVALREFNWSHEADRFVAVLEHAAGCQRGSPDE